MALTAPQIEKVETSLKTGSYRTDPYPTYRTLRTEAPVYHSPAWNGWVVTRHADVETVLNHPEQFTAVGRLSKSIEHLDQEVLRQIEPSVAQFAAGLQHTDPPDHTRIHKLVNRALTPTVVNRMADQIQAFADELLAPVLPTGQCDLIQDFAEPLPIRVLGHLFGFTAEECERFRRWDDDFVALLGSRSGCPNAVGQARDSVAAQSAWLAEVTQRRRREPRDDLFGMLVQGLDSGQLLNAAELHGTYVAILIGGHETTTGLISSAMMWLARHPDQRDRLRKDPALMPVAIEEFLRYESPLQIISRVATETSTLGGVTLPKGDLVMAMLGAANRDDAVFKDPDRLDITRRPNRHVAFGSGVHFCIGALLARVEARVALTTLLRHMPDFRVTSSQMAWRRNDIFRVLESLPVSFEAVP